MTPAITSCAISRADLALLIGHAAGEHPREACGLLLGTPGAIARVERTRNVAADPLRTFEIDPAALLRVHREARGAGLAVIGWYHSHPGGSAEPSRTDAARAVEDGMLWLVVADGGAAAWRTVPGGPVHGRFAPVALEPR